MRKYLPFAKECTLHSFIFPMIAMTSFYRIDNFFWCSSFSPSKCWNIFLNYSFSSWICWFHSSGIEIFFTLKLHSLLLSLQCLRDSRNPLWPIWYKNCLGYYNGQFVTTNLKMTLQMQWDYILLCYDYLWLSFNIRIIVLSLWKK